MLTKNEVLLLWGYGRRKKWNFALVPLAPMGNVCFGETGASGSEKARESQCAHVQVCVNARGTAL